MANHSFTSSVISRSANMRHRQSTLTITFDCLVTKHQTGIWERARAGSKLTWSGANLYQAALFLQDIMGTGLRTNFTSETNWYSPHDSHWWTSTHWRAVWLQKGLDMVSGEYILDPFDIEFHAGKKSQSLTPGTKNLLISQTLHPCPTSNLSHGKMRQKCAGLPNTNFSNKYFVRDKEFWITISNRFTENKYLRRWDSLRPFSAEKDTVVEPAHFTCPPLLRWVTIF